MKDTVLPPEKFVDYYDLDAGANPYPFMVIVMGSANDSWEAYVHEVRDDQGLRELVKDGSHAPVVFAALRGMYPVRFKNHYMYIPVKNQFFEVVIPFDG